MNLLPLLLQCQIYRHEPPCSVFCSGIKLKVLGILVGHSRYGGTTSPTQIVVYVIPSHRMTSSLTPLLWYWFRLHRVETGCTVRLHRLLSWLQPLASACCWLLSLRPFHLHVSHSLFSFLVVMADLILLPVPTCSAEAFPSQMASKGNNGDKVLGAWMGNLNSLSFFFWKAL